MGGWASCSYPIENITVHNGYFKQPKKELSPPFSALAHEGIIHRVLVSLVDAIHRKIVFVHNLGLECCTCSWS